MFARRKVEIVENKVYALCEARKIQIDRFCSYVLKFYKFLVRILWIIHNLSDSHILSNRTDGECSFSQRAPGSSG